MPSSCGFTIATVDPIHPFYHNGTANWVTFNTLPADVYTVSVYMDSYRADNVLLLVYEYVSVPVVNVHDTSFQYAKPHVIG